MLSAAAVASAQPRSIGLRAGNNWDLSYQHYLNESSFLTIETGVPGVAFGKDADGAFACNMLLGAHLAVIYDMLDPYGATIKWDKKGEWHWYMGCGLKGGIYGYNDPKWHAGLATHIGIEYDFEFPMILFIDSRATFGVTNYGVAEGKKVAFDGIAPLDLALGIRYKFN